MPILREQQGSSVRFMGIHSYILLGSETRPLTSSRSVPERRCVRRRPSSLPHSHISLFPPSFIPLLPSLSRHYRAGSGRNRARGHAYVEGGLRARRGPLSVWFGLSGLNHVKAFVAANSPEPSGADLKLFASYKLQHMRRKCGCQN